jgi:hypothetical protein
VLGPAKRTRGHEWWRLWKRLGGYLGSIEIVIRTPNVVLRLEHEGRYRGVSLVADFSLREGKS